MERAGELHWNKSSALRTVGRQSRQGRQGRQSRQSRRGRQSRKGRHSQMQQKVRRQICRRVKMCVAPRQEVTLEVPDAAEGSSQFFALPFQALLRLPFPTPEGSRCAGSHSPMAAPFSHQWQWRRGSRYYRLLSHTPLAISQLTPRLTA